MCARGTAFILASAVFGAGFLMAQSPNSDTSQSPAARPRPTAARVETYPAEQVRAGEGAFVSQCGFCHGRDATGDESGPDLTRSELVAADVRGDKIGPVVRAGRPDAGMPSFQIRDEELNSIAAFIHTQANKFATLGGGRRTVQPEDLATGNAADGRVWFNGAGGCSSCHSTTGDLAGVAKRFQGLTLLQRILYPGGRSAPAPKATFTLASGQTIIAPVVAEDEFSVTILDPLGKRQNYSRDEVKVKIEDPLAAHFDLLGKYTDAGMHNVLAYLETLK